MPHVQKQLYFGKALTNTLTAGFNLSFCYSLVFEIRGAEGGKVGKKMVVLNVVVEKKKTPHKPKNANQ